MASLSELLNPTPLARSTSPRPSGAMLEEDATMTSDSGFAPDLFQADRADGETPVKTEDRRESQSNERLLSEDRRNSVADSVLNGIETAANPENTVMRAPAEKPSKRNADKKDTRHSSKNEGQHTDRRYLCYLCHKLFTRRRSVRDHLAKIHNTKTWEPTRSLEIIVEPETGEPAEPLEAQIAKGGALPLSTHDPGRSESQDVEATQDDPEPKKATDPPTLLSELFTDEMYTESTEPTAPAPIIGKKRPLPINKRGTAKFKTSTPNKRPRLVDSESRTPLRSPSVNSTQRAPLSKLRKATESPASSRAQSVDVSPSPTSSAETPGSVNDDGEVFCICRKGDNHTWMIACDGGCEEWYHGGCVNIRERDGDLIDKYVCPKCTKAGFHTTWKRMCRRKECRKPARVFDIPPSKYCSKDCGRLFMVDLIKRGDPHVQTMRNGQHVVEMEKPKKLRRRRHKGEKKKRLPGDVTPFVEGSRPHTPAYSDDEKSEYETDSSLDDDMLPNRGGPLRAGEVKALLERCKSIEAWRQLGRKPATPPNDPDAMVVDDASLDLDDFERTKLATVKKEKTGLVERTEMLEAREELLELIKKRSTGIAEEVKKSNPKQKDICGYDPRLAWSEPQFVRWWRDQGGMPSLQSGKIGPPPNAEDENMTNGHMMSDDEDASGNSMPTKGGVCIKNRCQRHGYNRWQKAQLAELRFELDLVRRAIDRLERQEKEIRDRAIVRNWSNRRWN